MNALLSFLYAMLGMIAARRWRRMGWTRRSASCTPTGRGVRAWRLT